MFLVSPRWNVGAKVLHCHSSNARMVAGPHRLKQSIGIMWSPELTRMPRLKRLESRVYSLVSGRSSSAMLSSMKCLMSDSLSTSARREKSFLNDRAPHIFLVSVAISVESRYSKQICNSLYTTRSFMSSVKVVLGKNRPLFREARGSTRALSKRAWNASDRVICECVRRFAQSLYLAIECKILQQCFLVPLDSDNYRVSLCRKTTKAGAWKSSRKQRPSPPQTGKNIYQ